MIKRRKYIDIILLDEHTLLAAYRNYSNKNWSQTRLNLVEQELILDKFDNPAEVLNNFFTNIVSNSSIPKYHN